MNASMTYRSRIYDSYASRFQHSNTTFDVQQASNWGRAYDWFLRGWMPAKQDAAILDLGCGNGKLLHFFQSRGYSNLTGVDVSPEQVRLARQVTDTIHETDVLQFLASTPGQFDLITGIDIIEHLVKDEVLAFLDGCASALRPGGRLILQTPNAATPWGAELRYGDFTHEVCFQHHSLSHLLELCGIGSTETREMGPVPWGYSLASTARWCVWQTIRAGLQVYCLAETGRPGKVFSRVFLASGTKSPSAAMREAA